MSIFFLLSIFYFNCISMIWWNNMIWTKLLIFADTIDALLKRKNKMKSFAAHFCYEYDIKHIYMYRKFIWNCITKLLHLNMYTLLSSFIVINCLTSQTVIAMIMIILPINIHFCCMSWFYWYFTLFLFLSIDDNDWLNVIR